MLGDIVGVRDAGREFGGSVSLEIGKEVPVNGGVIGQKKRSSRLGAREQKGRAAFECISRGLFKTIMLPLLAAGLFGQAGAARAAGDVLTQHNDNNRTGANTSETVLTTANVKPDTFGKLWTLYADAQIVAQPLYVSGLTVDVPPNAGAPAVNGKFNVLLVATMHNTLYAYDADRESRLPDGKTAPLWATWLGPPRPSGKDIDMWSTNDPEWGIVGTPVIDPAKTTVWLVAWHNLNGVYSYRLHALNLKNGTERQPSTQIGGAPVDATKPCNYQGGFNPCTQKNRPGLLLSQGNIYVAFGGDGNRGNVFAFDAATLAQKGFWSVTPTGRSGGIWQSGLGLAADEEGTLYFVTGNGTFDADKNGKNFGDSFVKLRFENGQLVLKDYFTPCNQKFMDDTDLDLGSGGAVLIPGTKLLFGGGKPGTIYLLSRENMGKYQASPTAPDCKNPNVLQEFLGTNIHVHGAGTTYGHIHSAPVFWTGPTGSRMYVWGENDQLKEYKFQGNKFVDTATPTLSTYRPPDGMPGGMLSLSSNAKKKGTGILWAVVPTDGDANRFRGVQGIVVALDAVDVSKQLWSSELAGPRDRLGLFAKYVPPTVAGGKVFVATYGDREALNVYGGNARPAVLPNAYYVAVYGLLPTHVHPAKPIINQSGTDVTVLKASATTPLALDLKTCSPVAGGSVDCTVALEKKLGTPAFHSFVVPAADTLAGCMVMKVTTASKRTGLADATGIGWYAADATAASQAMTSGRFLATSVLKQAGTGVLKSGEPASLQEFVGVVNCSTGTAPQAGSLDKLFKPFMQFENTPDKIFRNWDNADNYRIGKAVPQFDRTADVLGP